MPDFVVIVSCASVLAVSAAKEVVAIRQEMANIINLSI
jgi:hypothetical protein